MNRKQSPLHFEIDRLIGKVSALSRRAQAAFFVTCGEALSRQHEVSAAEHSWAAAATVIFEKSADLIWAYAEGSCTVELEARTLMEKVLSLAADGDDAPQSIFAQDAMICFYEALRCVVPSEDVNSSAVEFVLEPTIQTACEETTGFVDLGSSSAASDWNNQAPDIPRVRTALQCCSELVDALAGKNQLGVSDRSFLRRIAIPLGTE